MFEQLAKLGVETVTLSLDNDRAGRTATVGAIEQATLAAASPALFVVDPAQLAPAKDPDAYVRTQGVNAYTELLASQHGAVTWRALEFTRNLCTGSRPELRRDALACAGAWLGRLPPRLTLEQQDAIHAVAGRCGYITEAIERAFRAQYWQPQELSQTRERHNPRGIVQER